MIKKQQKGEMESGKSGGVGEGEETELERGEWGSRGVMCFLGGNILPRTLINKAEGAELAICDLLMYRKGGKRG